MNHNEELFNEKEFEDANKGLQHIQKYNDNKETINLFLDMFQPDDELLEKIWKLFGEAFVISSIMADETMLENLNSVKEHYELLEPPFDFLFLAKTAMDINSSELSEKITESLSQESFAEGILNQILFQYGVENT